MNSASTQLLKRLEPPVRPVASGAARVARTPIHEQSFSQLLTMVSSGELHSGRSIDVAFQPDEPMSAAQLDRLADAADLAESRGATTALMLIDGRGFVFDVAGRQLLSELHSPDHECVNLDAAVFVAGDKERDQAALAWSGGASWPRSVLDQLVAAHGALPGREPASAKQTFSD